MKPAGMYVILIAILVLVSLLSLAAGATGETLIGHWDDDRMVNIYQVLVVPRLIMGMLAGAALAMAGAMFQALFRNPLASPYTLGVSSGASFGATAVIILLGGGLWHGIPIVNLAAFAGALTAVLIVYGVAHLRQGQSIGILLLAGVTIGFICSAGIVLLMFFARRHDLADAVQWMMGSLQIVGFDPVWETLAMVALAAGVGIYLHRDLDLLMMGEQVAAGRGVPVVRSRRMAYFAASLLTAGVVAHCGPIGFVGLIVPHVVRFFFGPAHRHMIPGCILTGAAFLPLCDLVARNALWWLRAEPRQLPVGVLTNLLGGAFFLYLLLRRPADRPMI